MGFELHEPILSDAEQLGFGSGLLLDFSNGYSESFKAGSISKQGLVGMLEASSFEYVDQGFLFLGAITNSICVNEQNLTLTQLSTSYVALFYTLKYRYISILNEG